MEKEMVKKLHDSNTNKVIIGNMDTGKTGNVLLPLVDYILEEKENILIIDSKEEYYKTYIEQLKENKYEVIVLNLRDSKKTNTWNPLEYPYKLYKSGDKDLAIDLLTKIGKIIFNDDSTSDPFWSNSATDFFIGVVLGLFEDAKVNEINLNSVFGIFNSDKKIKESYLINRYFSLKDKNDPAYLSASGTAFAPKETRASILSVAKQKLKPYVFKYSLTNMLAKSNFDFEKLADKKTAIFIITKDENTDINLLAPIFISNLYTLILNKKQKIKYDFVLDNFDTLVNVEGLVDMLSSSTYRNINFYMGIRNYDNFVNTYGKAVENILTVVSMESHSIKIESNVTTTKTVKGSNILKKDLYFTDAEYPKAPNNTYKIFDLEKFVTEKFIEQVDKQIDNITKGASKGVDKLGKKVNELTSDLGIDEVIDKIDKKIAELSKGKKD